MTRYIALVDRHENAVGFSFPDLPGCTAQGVDFERAYDDAVEALAEWIADEAAAGRVHHASSLEEIRKREDFQIALGDPHVTIAYVPLARMSGRSTRANITLDSGLLSEVDGAAERRGVTRSAWMTSAVHHALKAGL